MSIKFKVIERGQPGIAGGGVKKFYASANVSGEKTLAGLTREIEKISTVSGADIRAVLYAMVDAATVALAEGQVVRLGELGSLRVNISSKGEDTATDVKSASIKRSKVIFTPAQTIRDMLSTLTYEKRK